MKKTLYQKQANQFQKYNVKKEKQKIVSELYQKEMIKRLSTLIEIKDKNLELKKKILN